MGIVDSESTLQHLYVTCNPTVRMTRHLAIISEVPPYNTAIFCRNQGNRGGDGQDTEKQGED